MKLSVVKILVAALLVAGCNRGAEHKKILDLGKVENSVYSNDYFNIQVSIPEGWIVQKQEQVKEGVTEHNEKVKAENKELGEQIEAGMQQTVYLLTVFQYEIGTVVSFNPSFMLVGEKLSATASLMDARGYLTQSGELLKQSGRYTVDDEFTPMTIGGKQFYSMNATMNASGINLNQQFIVAIMDGYALVFILTFNDDEQLNTLQQTLASVKFHS
jgi:hypothetical protein